MLTENEQLGMEQLNPQECVFCKHKNSPECEVCVNCKRPLNAKTAINLEKEEKELLRMLTPEMVKAMFARALNRLKYSYRLT